MGKEEKFVFQERRQITLLIGHMADSDRAVYAYLDYSPELVDKLIEENPNWLREEVAKYQMVYTTGAIILRSRKPRKYHSSTPKEE